jgi:hypothetical protein
MSAVKLAGAAALVVGLTGAAWGQEIQERKENQQDRIAQGVQSGQLTAGETARLENKEAALNKEERSMRTLDGGKLTPQDRRTLNQQQNQLSSRIYAQRHDGDVQPQPRGEVGARQENQQDRIAQGVKSGQLTAGETARLERREAGLSREVRSDRKANGGTLTPQERRQVNHQENRLSNQIYRGKHDARRQAH